MSFSRHSMFGPLALKLFFGLFPSLLLSYFLQPYLPEPYYALLIGFGFYFLGALLFLYVTFFKPLNKVIREMKALLTENPYKKIYTKRTDELGVIAHFFNQVVRNFEGVSSTLQSEERMKKELNLAQKIQDDLIPDSPPAIPGLEIAVNTQPASEIGGDTYDFYQKNERWFLYIGDSTGHGVPAGIVMVMVDALLETFIDLFDSPVDMIVNLNKYLKPHLQTTMFMTMIFAEWVQASSSFNWIGCGHEYVVHVKSSTNEVFSLPSGGIAVGMVPDNSALTKEQSLQMDVGDFVVLFTDGITEAKNVNTEIYDMTRLCEYLKTHAQPNVSAQDLFDGLVRDVSRFMSGHVQEDDMTLMILKKTG